MRLWKIGLWALADDAGAGVGGAGVGGAGAGGAGGAGAGAAGGAGGDTTIPKERLDAEIAKRRTLEARLAELEQTAAQAGQWKAQAEQGARALDLAKVGITDPEAIEVASMFYEKLPKADRPAMAEWLKGLKDKPDTAPMALRGYLGGAVGAPPGKLGGGNAGGGGPGNAGKASLTPEEILDLSTDQYKAQRGQILGQYRGR